MTGVGTILSSIGASVTSGSSVFIGVGCKFEVESLVLGLPYRVKGTLMSGL